VLREHRRETPFATTDRRDRSDSDRFESLDAG
jgi:hypothetical protein